MVRVCIYKKLFSTKYIYKSLFDRIAMIILNKLNK